MGHHILFNLYLPFIIHFSIIITLCIFIEFNKLEFLGLNLSVGILLKFIWTVASVTYNTWLSQLLGHNVNIRKLGKWAVVTGATDGIGLAYCREIAKRGLNVVLISRNLERLQNSAKSLQADYSIETKIIQMDFSVDDVLAYDAIEQTLTGLDIGLLINNVGMTYSRPTHFHELPNPNEFMRQMIHLNVTAVTMMTKIVLPGMVGRGKGAILNIGSYVSCNHSPWYSLYSASKAFMDKLTHDMALEYERTGVIFQYQAPGYIATKMSKIKKSSWGTPNPEQYARVGIQTIGVQRRTGVWPVHRAFINGFAILDVVLGRNFESFIRNVMYEFWLFAKKRELEKLSTVYSHKQV
jgi:17beta-estradiol 17-dehydrogenase / very-long-chain 3-oxoacyl-CoA reductase